MGPIPDQRPDAQLGLLIAYPHDSGDASRRVSIRITDRASRYILADMEITAEQFTDLLSTNAIEVTAKVPSEDVRYRLFKEREHTRLSVPKELGGKWEYSHSPEAVDAWAEKLRVEEGWDVCKVETQSQSFYATFERWV